MSDGRARNVGGASPTVHVVTPVHNRRDLTARFLSSMVDQTYGTTRWVVFDDGSTDGTAEMIASDFPQIEVLRGDGTAWWAGALNAMVTAVMRRAARGDLVLTMNDDCVVGPGYVTALVEAHRQHPRSLIGSICVDSRDPHTVVAGPLTVDWMWAMSRDVLRGGGVEECRQRLGQLVQADVLPGRGTLVPCAAYRDVGLYAADMLPHYGADYEFALRATRHGYGLLVALDAVVVSDVWATGLNMRFRDLTVRQFMRSHFSVRSPNNLRYRWRYARTVRGRLRGAWFFTVGTLRNFGGGVRTLVRRRAH